MALANVVIPFCNAEYLVNKVTAHRCPALLRRFAHNDKLELSAGRLKNFVYGLLNARWSRRLTGLVFQEIVLTSIGFRRFGRIEDVV